MLFRQLPFSKTCRNLYFNLKNYKLTSKRPAFRSLNHPFCTNSQLLDASYTSWLLKTSKTIPSKIFNHITEKHERERQHRDREEDKFNSIPPSAIYINQASNLTVRPELTVNDQHPQSSINEEVLKLTRENNIRLVSEKLKMLKEDYGVVVEPEIVNQIFELSLKNAPIRENLIDDCDIETPLFKGKVGLHLTVPYYKFIYHRIPHLYLIFQTYEKMMFNNKKFQENYIWLCYHMDDLDTLQQLIYVYLKHTDYESKILSYVMSGFILNYEVEFSKTLFQNLVGQCKQLDPKLLETVTYQFIKVDSLFENLVSVLEVWIKSNYCEKPTPTTISLILSEYYTYGNKEEIQLIQTLTSSLGYSDHHLIRQANLKHQIIGRDPNSIKKEITKADIIEFNEISKSLQGNKAELEDFYHSFMDFFGKYSDLKMIKFVIYKMQNEGIELNGGFFNIISKYYVSHEKFLQLLNYLQAISKNLEFNEIYLRDLFDGFVNTYPHYAQTFTSKFHKWIKENSIFKESDKDRLLSMLRIVKLESQYTPYRLYQNLLDSKKYESCDWSKILWERNIQGKSKCATAQVNFRISKGFNDVLRKGVKPDYRVLETTFRRLNIENKRKLFELVESIRIPQTKYEKLRILDLQIDATKPKLLKYYAKGINHLNSNNRVLLGRIFFNNGLYTQATEILQGMRKEEMNDRTYMAKLNIELRNFLACGDYASLVETIQQFPIDDIVLSEYIYNQCCYIEKKLMQKLANDEKKELQHNSQLGKQYSYVTEDGNLVESMPMHGMKFPPPKLSIEPALKALRGLIGDIDARLAKDKIDITKEIQHMFTFLNKWITNERDERKI